MQGTCNSSQILQSLPQSTEHFALAEYDSSTTCEEVREPNPRGRFTTKKELSLDFVALDNQISQLVPYTVCMDTTWRAGDFEEQIVGPVSTYVFLENRCTNGSASVAIQLVRDASAPQPTSTSPSILSNSARASLLAAAVHVCSVVCLLGEALDSILPRKQVALSDGHRRYLWVWPPVCLCMWACEVASVCGGMCGLARVVCWWSFRPGGAACISDFVLVKQHEVSPSDGRSCSGAP